VEIERINQQHLLEIERIKHQYLAEIERLHETALLPSTSSNYSVTESGVSTSSNVSEDANHSDSSSGNSPIHPNLDTNSASDASSENSSSSCKRRRRRCKRRAHVTVSRKLEHALERCRLLEARVTLDSPESSTRLPVNSAVTTTQPISSDKVDIKDQTDGLPKTKPVWLRVEQQQSRGKRSNTKQHLNKSTFPIVDQSVISTLPSPTLTVTSVSSLVVDPITTISQPSPATVTSVSKQKRRKKSPRIDTIPNPQTKESIYAAKTTMTNSKAAERRRRANGFRKKAARSSREPTLRRHCRRKQREPPSTVASPANPQSRQEDSLDDQKSKEVVHATVSTLGRS